MAVSRLSPDRHRLARRIQAALLRKGMTQAGLADAIAARTGTRPGQSTISNWSRGAKAPSSRYLPVLIDVLDLSWADFGLAPAEGPPKGMLVEQPSPSKAETRAERLAGTAAPGEVDPVVLIPRVAIASAGAGYINDEEPAVACFDAFTRSEVFRLANANPDDLRTIKVVGDSMEPEIRANDTVAFLPTRNVGDHGIYVVAVDDRLLVKKVQCYGGGALEIIPSNPAYAKELFVPLPEADTRNTYRSERSGLTCTVDVVGKVVFFARPA